MSLINALNVGKSALVVHQAALQVTGNNIANAGNADYTRQTTSIGPTADHQVKPGLFVGTGVTLNNIRRQIDEALQNRLRGSVSDADGADAEQQWLSRVEAMFNELSDDDVSTRLSTFFNSWSNLANEPQDVGRRQIVLQGGEAAAASFRTLRDQLVGLQKDLDARQAAAVKDADGLAQRVADLNSQISQAEGGTGGIANGLRDQRDAALKELAQIVDVKVVDTGDGMVNVTLGSEPLVIGSNNRGLKLKTGTTPDGQLTAKVVFKADGGTARITSGQLGAMAAVRGKIDTVVAQTDELAGNLIFELNKVHAAGQGLKGFTDVVAGTAVADATKALNSAEAKLPFAPTNGSFVVHVKQKGSGLETGTLVKVNLDGLNADDTTLATLAADLDAIDGVTATVTGGRLRLKSDSPDIELSFSQDSSGTLAALGVNAFFTGKDARDITVNDAVKADPGLLAAAKNGNSGDNQTARAIAALETTGLARLDGGTLKEAYQSMVNGVALDARTAKTNAQATQTIRDTLAAQREALSGVSLDEEAINLVKQQRAFQGAARFLAAVDEMMKTVLQLV